MTKREAGSLGGRRVVELYGREHMARIGALGFAKISTFIKGGREAALARLASKGRLTPRHIAGDDRYDSVAVALYVHFGLD
jgi:hypothetical protein